MPKLGLIFGQGAVEPFFKDPYVEGLTLVLSTLVKSHIGTHIAIDQTGEVLVVGSCVVSEVCLEGL